MPLNCEYPGRKCWGFFCGSRFQFRFFLYHPANLLSLCLNFQTDVAAETAVPEEEAREATGETVAAPGAAGTSPEEGEVARTCVPPRTSWTPQGRDVSQQNKSYIYFFLLLLLKFATFVHRRHQESFFLSYTFFVISSFLSQLPFRPQSRHYWLTLHFFFSFICKKEGGEILLHTWAQQKKKAFRR